VDIYVADPDAQGGVMPGTYLGTFFDDGPEDLDLTPGAFTFDLSGLAVPGGRELCVVITYSLHEAESEFATSVTSPVSNTVETGGSASDPIGELQVSRDGSNLVITWEGGTPPFQVQRRSELTAGAWEDLGEPTEERTATVAISGDHEFFRVQGQ